MFSVTLWAETGKKDKERKGGVNTSGDPLGVTLFFPWWTRRPLKTPPTAPSAPLAGVAEEGLPCGGGVSLGLWRLSGRPLRLHLCLQPSPPQPSSRAAGVRRRCLPGPSRTGKGIPPRRAATGTPPWAPPSAAGARLRSHRRRSCQQSSPAQPSLPASLSGRRRGSSQHGRRRRLPPLPLSQFSPAQRPNRGKKTRNGKSLP